MEYNGIFEEWPLLILICGIILSLTLTPLLILCVCAGKKVSETDEENPSSSKNKRKSGNAAQGMTEIEMRNQVLQGNGSVPHDNGRQMSHEDRALPEIPSNTRTVMDVDEIDGGHYDIISRTAASAHDKPTAAHRSKVPKKANSSKDIKSSGKKKKKNHSYEEVKTSTVTEGDTDSTTYAIAGSDVGSRLAGGMTDPTYAAVSDKKANLGTGYSGVKDDMSDSTYTGVKDSQSESSLGGGSSTYAAGKGNHPYATVLNIGDADYAQITEKRSSKRKSKPTPLPKGSDTMESIAIPPPVPDKVLDPNEIQLHHANSPNLPPRNNTCATSALSNLDDIPYADEGTPSVGNSPQHQPSTSVGQLPASSNQTGAKSEPPYSTVTARESLGELRRRNELEDVSHLVLDHQSSSAMNFNYEPMDYQSIDYEMIKPTSINASRNQTTSLSQNNSNQAGDRNSISSDLYAEIGNTAGDNQSLRSSTYAQVSELSVQRSKSSCTAPPPSTLNVRAEMHAPTPPPLSHLPKKDTHLNDRLSGNGAANIARPASVCSSNGSWNYNTVLDSEVEYAVIDKSLKRKNKRQTVHLMNSTEASASNSKTQSESSKQHKRSASGSSPKVPDRVYSKIDKNAKRNLNDSDSSSSKDSAKGKKDTINNQTAFS